MDIVFENKYVAFIDVLGFSSMVEGDNQDKLTTYFNVLGAAFELFDETKQNIKKQIISDSIILIANDDDDDFKVLLTAISNLQASLASFDIWVRGGIAFGPIFNDEDKNVIVGKGYIKAYTLEKEAKYPRVIIDPSIVSKMGLNLQQFYKKFNGPVGPTSIKLIHNYEVNGRLRLTEDDAIFVNYANRIMIESLRDPFNDVLGARMSINNLKRNLYGPQQHYHKYLWLKKYFHEVIIELNNFVGVEALDKEKLNNYLLEFGSL